jgi:GTP cyclohydrolase I
MYMRLIAHERRQSRAEVEAAVRTIIRWTGEDPDRDGLIETPARVTRSFQEFFSGYGGRNSLEWQVDVDSAVPLGRREQRR